MKSLFFTTVLFLSLNSQAVTCRDLFQGSKKYTLIGSGRDHDVLPKYEKVMEKLLGPNGLLQELGIHLPKQTYIFTPGQEVSALVARNMDPIGHWYDGAEIIRANEFSRGVLEFVVYGKTNDRAIFRDDLSIEQQLSIIFHVIGHSDFGVHTRYKHMRDSDRIQESRELYELIERLQSSENKDEVIRWYQYLQSLSYAQDMHLASYATPEMTRTNYSRNLLQAFVADLSPHLPAWKLEVARRFEKLNRYIPAAYHTKIMNEGWAVFMQWVLGDLGVWNDFNHKMEYCCLLHGVLSKSISNPYFVGSEIWKNIYQEFKKEHKNLEGIALAKEFISFAHKEIIGKMDDVQFLRFGLTDTWMAKYNLAIAQPIEKTANPPPPPPEGKFQNPTLWKIISREPQRVRESLIQKITGKYFSQAFPTISRIKTSDESVYRLTAESDIDMSISLDAENKLATLYVMAQMRGTPVALESSAYEESYKKFNGSNQDQIEFDFDKLIRINTYVFPDGRVQVYKVSRKGSFLAKDLLNLGRNFFGTLSHHEKLEILDASFSTAYQSQLKKIITFMNLETEYAGSPLQALINVDQSVATKASAAGSSMFQHTPTVPRAIMAYTEYLSRRLQLIIQLAATGKFKTVRTANGMSVKVLPDIPHFQYDHEELAALEREETFSAKVSSPIRTKLKSKYLNTYSIKSMPGEEGYVDWGEGPPPQSKKKKSQDSGGDQAGRETGMDPTWVEIPIDLWGKVLENLFELPNLRPKSSSTNIYEEVKDDAKRGHRGQEVLGKIAREALKLGLADALFEKMQNGEISLADAAAEILQNPTPVFERGLRKLDIQKDWWVRDTELEMQPDTSVVIYLMLDYSGSMANFLNTAKQIAFDFQARLIQKYQKIEFRYIAVDAKAHLFTSMEELLKLHLGGATEYIEGLKFIENDMKEYPEAQWDKYMLIIGDMDDGSNAKFIEKIEAMKKDFQFTAGIRLADHPNPANPIHIAFSRLDANDPYFGYSDLATRNYTPLIFKTLFKNKRDK